MHKNNFYISFGVWVAILPFLGIPGTWRNALVCLSGLFLVLVSVGPIILKKLQTKTKPKRKSPKIDSQETPSQNNELRFSAEVQNESPIETEQHEN
jgi:hypothetical protein